MPSLPSFHLSLEFGFEQDLPDIERQVIMTAFHTRVHDSRFAACRKIDPTQPISERNMSWKGELIWLIMDPGTKGKFIYSTHTDYTLERVLEMAESMLYLIEQQLFDLYPAHHWWVDYQVVQAF